jgi:hypothetical protein
VAVMFLATFAVASTSTSMGGNEVGPVMIQSVRWAGPHCAEPAVGVERKAEQRGLCVVAFVYSTSRRTMSALDQRPMTSPSRVQHPGRR